ncbi:2-phospho-L-lactate transferase [Granulicoccus phenolivorans]|uniref:2-phospho-L-lactate transferase n=1 Tax=Granulicoccus phenolivorans TaxID=266854 RepID=UPI0004182593|nr:2-phospho-L-lactate transferase [Granulicoccus phenolivorans]
MTTSEIAPARITVLAGGVGGSRFVRGVRAAWPAARIDVIGNTADDISLHGLRICPDLDTMMYALGGGIDAEKGWGRNDEGWRIAEEFEAYGIQPRWFQLGDRDIATHLVRTELYNAGYSNTEITLALQTRWLGADSPVRILPMTDERVETHIVVADPEQSSGQRAMHFQEFWVRYRAALPVIQVVQVGIDQAKATDAVLESISTADLVLIAPSNPVVSIGPILGVSGVRAALRATRAPVIGVSGILGGAPVLGMADKLLPAIGVAVSAAAVGRHYGPRNRPGGILDRWVVDQRDAAAVAELAADGLDAVAVDTMMTSPEATAAFLHTAVAAR